ncbi:MAG: D-amino acid aminotransferase [candidate division KSB1 bacterium]
MLVYLNGKFLPREQAMISVNDRGFLFGDSLYEVIRGYRGLLFEAQAHLQRLQNGLHALRLRVAEFDRLAEIAQHLLATNDLLQEDTTIYFQITRGAPFPRKHAFPAEDTPPTVYVTANKLAFNPAYLEHGVAVITVPDVRWNRCDLKTTNLLANVLANQQAHEAEAYEALFVREGFVTEGSHSNFFAVANGTLHTHPISPAILPGITRQVVLKLCHELQLHVEETPLAATQLPEASEAFLSLTSAEVLPVIKVDDKKISEGKPGEITQRLQRAFGEYVKALRKY